LIVWVRALVAESLAIFNMPVISTTPSPFVARAVAWSVRTAQGRLLGVHGVGLAASALNGALRPVDFDHLDACGYPTGGGLVREFGQGEQGVSGRVAHAHHQDALAGIDIADQKNPRFSPPRP
jgi:hypothetical protein